MSSSPDLDGIKAEPSYEPDTDEVQSLDSEVLHRYRPNRWSGFRQHWLELTEAERLDAQALDNIRKQDLSAHLYNAFAIKSRAKAALSAPPRTRGRTKAEEPESSVDPHWVPPTLWTAWPMRERHMPLDDFMPGRNDGDDIFTARQRGPEPPSRALEDVISATMLKMAGQRFRGRRLAERSAPSAPPSDEEMDSRDPTTSPLPHDEGDETQVDAQGEPAKGPQPSFRPGLSVDDEANYAILRPSAREILGKLDRTLTIMHNVRIAASLYLSDSSATSGAESGFSRRGRSVSSRRTGPKQTGPKRTPAPGSRPRGRPRKNPVPVDAAAPTVKRGRGRPRKHPLPQKPSADVKAAPPSSDEEEEEAVPDTEDEEVSRSQSGSEDEQTKEDAVRAARAKHRRVPKIEDLGTSSGEDKPPRRFKRPSRQIFRWNLRDWSDVLGAAALADFSPQVLARTRERCARLFGQDMTLYTVEGATAAQRRPGRSKVSELAQPASSSDDAPVAAGRHKHRTGDLPCPFADCERAARGFTRRDNLVRHLRVVHAQTPRDVARLERAAPLEGRRDLHGGVHVDGFLQPVRNGPGQRGPDVRPRRASAGRRESDADGGGGEVVYGSESS